MKQSKFPATVQIEEQDLNGIHENTEDAIKVLLEAISGGETILLFKDQAPSISDGGTTHDILVPSLYFSVNGVIQKTTATTYNALKASGDRTISIYFRVKKQDISATRQYINLAPGETDPAVGSDSFVVAQEDIAEVVFSDPDDGEPDAVTGQVGSPILYATIAITSSGAAAAVDEHDPNGRLWQFPGGALPAAHGSSHTGNGVDPIPEATASDSGLLSVLDYGTVRAAITAVTASGSAPFLVLSTSGDNASAGTRKATTINLRVNSSTFVTEDPTGSPTLGLNFTGGANAGTSVRPARSDHKHGVAENPFQVVQRTLVIDNPASQLNSVVSFQMPETFGLITSVAAYWLAPGITSPQYPLIQASWTNVLVNGLNSKIGVRAIITGPRTVKLRIGDYALTQLNAAEQAEVLTVTGTNTWQSAAASNGLAPTTGTLLLYVTGVRTGVNLVG